MSTNGDFRTHNNLMLERMLGIFATQDRLLFGKGERKASDAERQRNYALAGLKKECDLLASTAEGGRNKQLWDSAAAIANLVAGGGVAKAEAEQALLAAAETCGLMQGEERAKTLDTLERAFAKGITTPRIAPAKEVPSEEPRDDPSTSDDPLDQYATVSDLIRAGTEIVWLWEPWIPRGVLTILAAAPGVGKTRLCCDIARRISKGLPWPDGKESTCPVGSRTLWIPADNQHPELATVAKDFGIDPELMFLNATKRNPFGGTMLDSKDDLKFFEKAIAAIQPQIVFVDTCLNATDRTAHKPEDAKAFFVPLAKIAQRQLVSIVLVTHLNNDGKPLGKRIEGQGRVVIQLEHPNPEGEPMRRKLHVVKTHSLSPTALGVTMFAAGNDYDTNPPQKAEERFGGQGSTEANTKAQEALGWLQSALATGKRRVSELRTLSEADGISAPSLYRAKTLGKIIETQDDRNKKWWELPSPQEGEETQF